MANVSHWGPKAESFLKFTADNIILVTEHRQHADNFQRFLNRVRNRKYEPIAHPAVHDPMGGPSGGVAILARRRNKGQVHIEPLAEHIYQTLKLSHAERSRLCAAIVQTKGLRILIVVIYGYHTEGLSDRQVSLLRAAEILIRVMAMPCLLGGDFNLSRNDLGDTALTTELNLEIVSSADNTCMEGNGSCIDHLLATRGFKHAVNKAAVTPEGFRPHLVSRVHFALRLKQATVALQLRVPAPILPPALFATVKDRVLAGDAWSSAQKESAKSLGLPHCVWDDFDQITPTQSLPLISLAFEIYLMEFRPFKPSPKVLHKYFGRGTPPQFSKRPVLQSEKGHMQPVAFWGLIENILLFLRCKFDLGQANRLRNLCENKLWLHWADDKSIGAPYDGQAFSHRVLNVCQYLGDLQQLAEVAKNRVNSLLIALRGTNGTSSAANWKQISLSILPGHTALYGKAYRRYRQLVQSISSWKLSSASGRRYGRLHHRRKILRFPLNLGENLDLTQTLIQPKY